MFKVEKRQFYVLSTIEKSFRFYVKRKTEFPPPSLGDTSAGGGHKKVKGETNAGE